mmetsp:Transcript_19858/g.35306  ORF Transcript_19858/g.35306 Transcript_19858/m.35306 type:complete len:214 (+) Transcript_19858:770-1411(+)
MLASQFGSGLEKSLFGNLKLHEYFLGRHAGLFAMLADRFRDMLIFSVHRSDLDSVYAILCLGLDLCHKVAVNLEYCQRVACPVYIPTRHHSDFERNKSGSARSTLPVRAFALGEELRLGPVNQFGVRQPYRAAVLVHFLSLREPSRALDKSVRASCYRALCHPSGEGAAHSSGALPECHRPHRPHRAIPRFAPKQNQPPAAPQRRNFSTTFPP